MKKIINSTMVICLTTLLFSCQKEKDLTAAARGTAANQTNANKLAAPPGKVTFTLSNWFAVPLSHFDFHNGTTDPNNLYGKYILKNPLTGAADTDVKLAYVRTASTGAGTGNSDGFTYYQLPADVEVRDRFLVNMNFNLTASQFELTVTGIGIIAVILDPQDFMNFGYRYIVISKADYDSMNIDWSNYKAVASALNFTP